MGPKKLSKGSKIAGLGSKMARMGSYTLPAAGAARRQLNDGTHDGWYHVPITSLGHVLSISKSFLERFFQKSSFLVCSLWLLRHVSQICI